MIAKSSVELGEMHLINVYSDQATEGEKEIISERTI